MWNYGEDEAYNKNIPIFGASNVQGVQNKPSTQTTNEDVDLETEEEFIAKVIESDAAYQKLKQSRIEAERKKDHSPQKKADYEAKLMGEQTYLAGLRRNAAALYKQRQNPSAEQMAQARIRKQRREEAAKGPKYFTKEQLAKYNGEDPSLPVYVSVKGKVYDVSESRNFVKGGSYSFFAGRDSSRAFATGSFSPEQLALEDDLSGMGTAEYLSLEQWANYFEQKPEYFFVGYLTDYKYQNNS